MLEQKIELLTAAVEKLTQVISQQETKAPEVPQETKQKTTKAKEAPKEEKPAPTKEPKPLEKETEYDLDSLFDNEKEEDEAPRFTDMASFSRYLAPIFMKLSDEKKGVVMDTISKNFGVTKLALLDEKHFNTVADLVEGLANQ